MKLTAKQLRRLLRYLGLGFAAYLVFLYLTFPSNLVKDRVLGEVERALGVGIHARDMSLGLINGIRLSGVELDFPQGPLALDVLQVRPRFLPLLIGRRSASFSVRSRQIEASGFSSQGKQLLELELILKKLELPALLNLLGQKDLNLTGSASGRLTLAGPPAEIGAGNFSRARGQLFLSLPKPAIEASSVKLPPNPAFGPLAGSPLNLPRTAFQELNANLALDQGTVKVSKFTLNGDDLSANLGGSLQLASLIPLSQLDLQVELTIGSKYRPQLDTFKGMLPTAIKVDGAKLAFRLGGSLRQPFLRD